MDERERRDSRSKMLTEPCSNQTHDDGGDREAGNDDDDSDELGQEDGGDSGKMNTKER